MLVVFPLFIYALTSTEAFHDSNVIAETADEIVSQLDRYTLLQNDFRRITEIIDHLKNLEKTDDSFCKTCERVADYIIRFRRTGGNREDMIALLGYICVQLLDGDVETCDGHARLNVDIMLHILDNRLNLTGARICAIMHQRHNCKDPHMPKWSIDLPPRNVSGRRRYNRRQTPFKVVHITDVHYDPNYLPGSHAICSEKAICCQRESTPPPNGTHVPAGYWGDYHICDAPWHSIQNMFDDVKARSSNYDFVYFTGDIISHRDWATSKFSNTHDIKRVFQGFRDTFGSIPVYPVLGNHEAHPVNFYSPKSLSHTNYSIQWLYDLSNEEWSHWLPEDTRETISRGGFYTTLIRPGLRLIALNTNVCYSSNVWLIYDDEDPYDQLKWLVNVLYQAEQNLERVHLIYHIPNGEIDCFVTWSHEFRRIIDRFAHIIAAQFNGHTHQDQIQLFYNLTNPKQVVNVAFNAASVTPYIANNPNYRIYDISPEDYSVSDYAEYIYNLTEANLTPTKSPRWYKLYNFKEAYGLPNTNFDEIGKLVQRMTNNITLVQQYYRYYVRESDAQLANGCDHVCMANLLCEIISSESSTMLECSKMKERYLAAKN